MNSPLSRLRRDVEALSKVKFTVILSGTKNLYEAENEIIKILRSTQNDKYWDF